MVYTAGGAGDAGVMAPAPWAVGDTSIYNAVIYDRDTGAGCAPQVEFCRAFAAKHGLLVVEELIDERMHALEDGPADWPWRRPALEQAFRIVEASPGTVLLVHSAARLSSYTPSLRMMALRHSRQILIASTGQFLSADRLLSVGTVGAVDGAR